MKELSLQYSRGSEHNCDKITTPMYDLIGAEILVVKELIKRNVLEM